MDRHDRSQIRSMLPACIADSISETEQRTPLRPQVRPQKQNGPPSTDGSPFFHHLNGRRVSRVRRTPSALRPSRRTHAAYRDASDSL